MWCTRWLLPLVILPLPVAPPFFLFVLLLSLLLHARPCVYCIILLSALFTSSCYWNPLAVDAPLTKPIGNATTFLQALNNSLSNALALAESNITENDIEVPETIELTDRCWCSFSWSTGIFEPSDYSSWEEESVEQLRRKIMRKAEAKRAALFPKKPTEEVNTGSEESLETVEEQGTAKEAQTHSYSQRSTLSVFRDLLFASHSHKYVLHIPNRSPDTESDSDQALDPTQPPQQSTPPEDLVNPSATAKIDANPVTLLHAQPSAPLSKWRGVYDLRPYGLDIIVDLRWSR